MKDELREMTDAFMANEQAVPARKRTQAETLVDLAADARLFHSPDQDAYAQVAVGECFETWPLRGKSFKRWLIGEYYKCFEKPPRNQALQET